MKHVIILSLLFIINITYAEPGAEKGVISGHVVDAITNRAIEFATVSIYSAIDSTLISGGISDKNGQYEISNLPYGEFYVSISFIGFKEYVIPDINLNKSNKFCQIPTIKLFPSDEQLPEVVISGERNYVDFKIDKKVVNVSQHANAAGGTVADVLENVPSVTVDIEGNISLRGSSAFTVLIDGKPTAMSGNDMLKQIPANTVEKIEVITNPSAKYDPEGTTGIINLIMKKGYTEGLNGMVSSNFATRDKVGGDMTLNYRKKGINYFLIGNYSNRPMRAVSENRRETYFSENTGFVNERTDRIRTMRPFRINPGADLYLNDKNTLSLSGTFGGWGMDRLFETQYEIYESTESTRDYSVSDNDFYIEGIYYVGNVNFQRLFSGNDHKLDLNIMAWNWDGEIKEESFEQTTDQYYKPNGFLSANRSDLQEDRNHLQLKADYTQAVGTGKLEAGMEVRLMDQQSDFVYEDKNVHTDQWEMNPAFTYEAKFYRNLYSAYTTFSNSIFGLHFQAGLRAEITDRKMTQLSNGVEYPVELTKLYPTLHLSKDLPDNQQLQFGYSRRINRPQPWQLNPFPGYSDSYNYFEGNPLLKPEDTDAFELNYINRFKNLTLSAGAFFRQTSNTLDLVQDIKPEAPNLVYLTYDNISKTKSTGLEWMFNYAPLKALNINWSGNLYHYELFTDFNGEEEEGKSVNWDSRLNVSYNLASSTKLQFITVYYSPSVRSQGRSESLYYFDLAIRQSFLNRKLNVSIHGHNIFSTGIFTNEIKNEQFLSWFKYEGEAPVVRLNISYIINNYKRKQRANADIGAGAN